MELSLLSILTSLALYVIYRVVVLRIVSPFWWVAPFVSICEVLLFLLSCAFVATLGLVITVFFL